MINITRINNAPTHNNEEKAKFKLFCAAQWSKCV